MLWFFFIAALVAAGWLFRRLFRLRRLLSELEEATRKKRRHLPREREVELKRMGVSGLVRQLNESIDHYNRHEENKAGYAMQVEAMLRAVQEVSSSSTRSGRLNSPIALPSVCFAGVSRCKASGWRG